MLVEPTPARWLARPGIPQNGRPCFPPVGDVFRPGGTLSLLEPAGAAGAKVNWSISGPCISDGSASVGDGGTIVIPASKVDVLPCAKGKTCEVTVTIERANPGTLATQFKEGSSITAKQVRSVTFNSTPAANE